MNGFGINSWMKSNEKGAELYTYIYISTSPTFLTRRFFFFYTWNSSIVRLLGRPNIAVSSLTQPSSSTVDEWNSI